MSIQLHPLLQWCALGGLALVGAFDLWLWQRYGSSALFWMGILCTLLLVWQLQAWMARQRRLPERLFQALANGDSSLGLPAGDPLRQSFDAARQRMQQARLAAEQQAQFLTQVLLHTELALLICRDNGEVIEQSPAAVRLLGQRVRNVDAFAAGAALVELVLNAKHHQQATIAWHSGEQPDTLQLNVSVATIAGEPIRLLSLQSIHTPLNQREQQAYNRLIRVLTHEVANSVTPLSSMAESCLQLLPAELCFTDPDDKADLQLALTALSRRTQHLAAFIHDFRAVAALPPPQCKAATLGPLLQQIMQLYQAEFRQRGVHCHLHIQADRAVAYDAAQIEQVLINLIKNALEAFTLPTFSRASPAISLTLNTIHDQQLCVTVQDNGPGITESAREMIFVPFFTTKPQGSGIGLALAKQIMVNHGGDLICVPPPSSDDEQGVGAIFRLIFS